MKLRLLIPALALALALAACGSDDASPGGDDGDAPSATIACLAAKGIEARETDEDEVELTGAAEGTRIRFYLTAGEAEAVQFEGEGEGSEQIGEALLFVEPEVDPETEDVLGDVERCLAEL
jgi:hypothetical protein